ncbi:hypothetical protein E8E14_003113, partial [Neopestalotiopsis sp. 37M]
LDDITKEFGYYAVSQLTVNPDFKARNIAGYQHDKKWATLIDGMHQAQVTWHPDLVENDYTDQLERHLVTTYNVRSSTRGLT